MHKDTTAVVNRDASRPSLVTPPSRMFSTNWVALLSNTTATLTLESKSSAVAAAEVGTEILRTSHLHGALVRLDATVSDNQHRGAAGLRRLLANQQQL